MKYLLSFCSLCSVFIVFFNSMGLHYDMSGFSPFKDQPATEAFQAPEIFPITQSPAQFISGQDVVLGVSLRGGAYNVQWFRDGKKIDGANSNLFFTYGAQPQHNGVYSVVATNSFGESRYDFEVKVVPQVPEQSPMFQGPPQIIYLSQGSEAILGKAFAITASVLGQGKIGYLWLKNGQPIINANSHRLSFNEVKRHHAGEYRLVVMNESGESTQTTTLRVLREIPEN